MHYVSLYISNFGSHQGCLNNKALTSQKHWNVLHFSVTKDPHLIFLLGQNAVSSEQLFGLFSVLSHTRALPFLLTGYIWSYRHAVHVISCTEYHFAYIYGPWCDVMKPTYCRMITLSYRVCLVPHTCL